MPLRFRRTLKIGPGVKLNLSKSGVSTTVGPKGIHFTFGKHGVRRSIGIPGTGISEVDYISKNETGKEKREEAEKRREEKSEEDREARAGERPTERPRRDRRYHEAASRGSTELRNAFVLLGVVVFFFAGAAVLGLMPAHFLSTSLQYLAHLLQSTGH